MPTTRSPDQYARAMAEASASLGAGCRFGCPLLPALSQRPIGLRVPGVGFGRLTATRLQPKSPWAGPYCALIVWGFTRRGTIKVLVTGKRPPLELFPIVPFDLGLPAHLRLSPQPYCPEPRWISSWVVRT